MTFFLSWLVADFITGVFHWYEDQILRPGNNPLINSIIADNELHHRRPVEMLKCTPWENIRLSCLIAWPSALGAYYLNAPTFIWLGIFLAGFGNLVHRWTHEPKSRLSPYILLLQWLGFFSSFDHHHAHHSDGRRLISRERSTIRYCAMSCYLNPILDRIKFWSFLNWLFKVNRF